MTVQLIGDTIPTPIGEMLLVTRGGALCAAEFGGYEARVRTALRRRHGAFELRPGAAPGAVRDGFARYFEGDADSFVGLPLLTAGTPFQESVWAALRATRWGERHAYSELAARIGRPRAVRAVGLANGRNPVAILIPCHRIVGRNGSLTGYAGGLERKAWLLAHEGGGADSR
jgi:methylated-DNA-[protein]-cysteine S-methyltransferase